MTASPCDCHFVADNSLADNVGRRALIVMGKPVAVLRTPRCIVYSPSLPYGCQSRIAAGRIVLRGVSVDNPAKLHPSELGAVFGKRTGAGPEQLCRALLETRREKPSCHHLRLGEYYHLERPATR
jgi:hypothetical protein